MLDRTIGQPTLGQDLGGIYDLITGIMGGGAVKTNQQGAAAADPFAPQRAQYQTKLAALMKDPNSFKTDPGYQFTLGQGQEGITRAENALYGTQRTGNLAPELAKFTEGYAAQSYNDRINQLMTLSGATTGSPAAAGKLLADTGQVKDDYIGGGIKSIGNLLPSILKMISGGGGGGNWWQGTGDLTSGVPILDIPPVADVSDIDSIIGSGDFGPW